MVTIMLKCLEKIKRGKKVNHFKYKNGHLHAEDVPVEKIANDFGTPLYIYSYATLIRHFKAYEESFKSIKHLTCYALKANSNSTIVKIASKEGCGADVVSGGELYKALKNGISPKKIIYAGVGKTKDEIAFAINKGILMFNVESLDELLQINDVAKSLKKQAPIALRINPDIDPQTHPYISTGLKKHKFGIPIEDALEHFKIAQSLANTKVLGIHMHIGSQLTNVLPFVDALKRILKLKYDLKNLGIEIDYLDIGGGIGINYNDEKPPHPSELSNHILPMLKNLDITLILEPGRSIVGNAGILVTKTLYLKKGDGKEFIIVDAAMNDLIRPSIYGAYHRIEPVKKTKRNTILADVVGPVCESGDFLAKDREIKKVNKGELIAVMSAGAYGFSMASNYNSRPRPAEVLVKGDNNYLIRKRETFRDLIKGEIIPDFI